MYKAIFFSLFFSCTAFVHAGQYGGGAGTAEDPYRIYTVEHLLELGDTTGDYGENFILMADIDMAGHTYTQAIIAPDLDDETWEHQGDVFTGAFDGDDHKILNLSLKAPGKSFVALFGKVSKSGHIKNLHLENASVIGENLSASLAGSMAGTVDNCSVTGKLGATYASGGLVGFLYRGAIVNSYCDITINIERISERNSAKRIGGLVGYINFGTVDHCLSKATIESKIRMQEIGGFVGVNGEGAITNSSCVDVTIKSNICKVFSIGAFCGMNRGSIQNCLATNFYVDCTHKHVSCYIGGLAGTNLSLIARSIAEGSVIGNEHIGGIAGKSSGYIIDCYSNVTTSANDNVGTFVGNNIYGILRSYSLGTALASQIDAGGFAGTNIGIIDLCFFDAQFGGLPAADCDAIAKRTAELKKIATYKCWGDGVWVIDPDGDYPRLAWENTPGIVITDEPSQYGGGNGSEEEPYLLYTAEHLAQIGLYPQDLKKHYKLMADIDLANSNFNGIGIAFGFGGVFDGNNHIISNYSINNDLLHAGLFTVILQSGVVKNLTVENFTLSGIGRVGGLCGKNEGKIENCQVFGSIYALPDKKGNWNWGGLVGLNCGSIEDCQAQVDMRIERNNMTFLGGFAGGNRGIIRRCGSIGKLVISGEITEYVGGFAGQGAFDSRIYDSYAQVAIELTGASCRSVGGFIGHQWYQTVTKNSYCSAPMIIPDDCQEVGAFIGCAGKRGSTATAAEQKVIILNCFWDTDVELPKEAVETVLALEPVLTPASRDQLTNMAFLLEAGWDIGPAEQENIWVLTPGELPRSHK